MRDCWSWPASQSRRAQEWRLSGTVIPHHRRKANIHLTILCLQRGEMARRRRMIRPVGRHLSQSRSFSTPPLSSREPSVPQSNASTSRPGNKRPQSAVIDLTLSDDEDDDPPRPAKRQSTINAQRSQPSNRSNHTKAQISLSYPESETLSHAPIRF
jgi:hypothetical protein